MEDDVSAVQSFVNSAIARIEGWIVNLSTETVIWSLIGVVLAFVFRSQIASAGLAVAKTILKQFSATLSEDVEAELRSAAEILVSVFSVFVAVQVLLPEGVAKVFLERVLASVAIFAVFGAWYNLSGPFVSLLRNEKTTPVTSEVDWVQRVTQFAILLFGVTSLLKVWQIDISGALTGVGVLGAGLAIAAQDLVRNLVAGMTNISEKRFETGDAIEIENQIMGTVERIDLRSTKIVGFDEVPRYVPNADLSNAIVKNYSVLKRRRVLVKVPLVLSSTQDQIEAVRDGLKAYHRTSGDFDLTDAAPKYIYVSGLGPSSIDIMIYAWTTGPAYELLLQVTERLSLAILRITREAGTKLAYPTQTLHWDPSAYDANKAAETPGDAEQPSS